jgi:hypothetical protein
MERAERGKEMETAMPSNNGMNGLQKNIKALRGQIIELKKPEKAETGNRR